MTPNEVAIGLAIAPFLGIGVAFVLFGIIVAAERIFGRP